MLEANVETGEANTSAAEVNDAAGSEEGGASYKFNDRISKAMERAKAGAPPATPESISIENLADAELPDGEHKGIDYNRVLKELPEDAQKLLANMRSSFTKKTQELAEQRKSLQSQMEALSKSGFAEKLNEVADRNTELDPYDTSSFENRIQEEVARRMREMVQPLEDQYKLDQIKMKYERFKSENPDLLQPEIKSGVKKLLDENPALDLPTAYKLVKADSIIKEQNRQANELTSLREAARQYGLKTSNGRNTGTLKPPAGLKAHELYNWFSKQKQAK